LTKEKNVVITNLENIFFLQCIETMIILQIGPLDFHCKRLNAT